MVAQEPQKHVKYSVLAFRRRKTIVKYDVLTSGKLWGLSGDALGTLWGRPGSPLGTLRRGTAKHGILRGLECPGLQNHRVLRGFR